jgi:hypothetical protein
LLALLPLLLALKLGQALFHFIEPLFDAMPLGRSRAMTNAHSMLPTRFEI